VVAVIVVLFTTVTLLAAALPNVTVAPLAKLAPVMVTEVPPAAAPEVGEMLATVGVWPNAAPMLALRKTTTESVRRKVRLQRQLTAILLRRR